MRNLYFELTEELNAEGVVAVLASGQAVVYYRLSIMSKDGDRILALASGYGERSRRAPVRAALAGRSRETVVTELARESDHLQQQDRARLEVYKRAAEPYVREFQAANLGALELSEAHRRACELAERWLPRNPPISEDRGGVAE